MTFRKGNGHGGQGVSDEVRRAILREEQEKYGVHPGDGRAPRPGEMPYFARSTNGPTGPADAPQAPPPRSDCRPRGVVHRD